MRLLFILIFCNFIGWAQLDNTVFNLENNQDSLAIKRFKWQLNGFSYFKNNEYFNEIVKGQTFFGNQITPKLQWNPSKKWQINGGFFIAKEFGNNEKYTATPIFNLKYNYKNVRFIFGNLESDLQHKIIEPLYNFERIFSPNRLEEGMQLIVNRKKIYADTWVNWLLKERNNTTTKNEKIEGGAVVHLSLLNANHFKIKAISNSLVYHQGGQNFGSPFSTYTTLHQSLGLNLSYELEKGSFVQKISTENHFIVHQTQSDSLGFPNGNAQYYNLTTNTKWGDFVLSYWYGKNFINPMGGDLFSGVSRWQNYKEENRRLLFLRWMKNIYWDDNLAFTLRAEPYYDLNKKLLEYSFSICLNYWIGR